MQIVAFDVETSDVFDLKPNEDLEKYAPFHVAVAAVVHSTGETTTWLSMSTNAAPHKNMTRETALELLHELRRLQESDHMVCAWNGASFDLRWLAYAAGDEKLASIIALDLYDPMLQFFNLTGFPVGLDAVARGLRLQETKMMGSDDAPKLWCRGEHDRVIEYVCSDARITTAIVERIQRTGNVSWVTKRGTVKTEHIGKLKRVREVLKAPEPDQSWMDTPIRREKFVRWILGVSKPITETIAVRDDQFSEGLSCSKIQFLMTIEDIFLLKGRGTVVTGSIEQGRVRVGDEVEILCKSQERRKTVVTRIEMFNKVVDEANVGEIVGLFLAGIEKRDLERGQILVTPGTGEVA